MHQSIDLSTSEVLDSLPFWNNLFSFLLSQTLCTWVICNHPLQDITMQHGFQFSPREKLHALGSLIQSPVWCFKDKFLEDCSYGSRIFYSKSLLEEATLQNSLDERWSPVPENTFCGHQG